MERSQPGNELAELLWENSPEIRWTAAPDPFPPFSWSADGTTSATAMAQGDHDNAVPWLHYPIIGVDDGDTECCSALLFRYSNHPTAMASRHARAPSMSHAAVVVPPLPEPPTVPKQQQQQPRPTGEGAINFPFFSRPLQRPLPQAGERASAGGSNPVDVQTNLLRSTPLFSKQRMAWLQPPKESPARPPPASPVPVRHAAEPAAALPPRLQPEVRAPATKTTSSVCFDKGDESQLKRSSHQVWSVSQEDEDLDDEAGGLRRSAARSTKRGRNAQVHNMSERRRRGRINDKIRALQELIPNCNKIDKASILEEAIEYVKTLQLQVQMMSTMGTAGLCVSPMVAMQHMQMPPMAHLHHHLLGAMGFGMGAFDPRLAGAVQFPYPMIPGVPMFHQAAAASAQMAAGTVTNNAAAAQTEQTPSQHPQVTRPM